MRVWGIILLLALLLAVGTPALAQGRPGLPREVEEGGVGGSDFHKNDITYSTEVVTPHVPWATKLPGGPIKGFFIPSIRSGRG